MNTIKNNDTISTTANRLRRFRPQLALGLVLSLTAVFCLYMFRAEASRSNTEKAKASEQSQFFADKNKPAPAVPLATLTCDTASNVDVEATAGTLQAGYATLSAAIAAINAGTHQGVINVEICANVTETAAMFLNSNAAAPASYTSVNIYPLVDGLTISGPTVLGRGLIELNGADNVTIDGDNPLTGGTNRNLTITNTAATTVNLTSVIRVAVIAAVPTADNITIRNLNVNGNGVARNVAGLTSTTNVENSSFAIYAGGLATGATTAPGPLTSVSTNTAASGTTINAFNVTNNAVNACARGIFFVGAAATVSTGVTISNNLVGDQVTVNTGAPPFTSPTTTVYTKPVFVAGTTALTITNNSIKNILSFVGTTMNGIELNAAIGAGGVTITGNTIDTVVNNGTSAANGIIHTQALGTYNISSNTITNIQASGSSSVGLLVAGTATSGTVAKNKITTVRSRSTGGVRAAGIVTSSGNAVTIQNNFVAEVLNIGSGSFGTSFNANGILLLGGINHRVYNNSVNLFGVSTSAGSNSVNCLAITASTQTGIDVRNNIFSNTVTGGAATDAHVGVFLPFAASATMLLTLNNNTYYTGSIAGKSGVAFAGVSAYAAANVFDAANFNPAAITPATNFRSFSTLLGVATNDDASFASTIAAPFFSATNLHITGGAPLDTGVTIVTVTDDIDGQTRPQGPAYDIGADEFVPSPGTVQFSAASYTNLENTTATITVNRVGGVSGAISVMYATSDGTATAGVCGSGGDYVSSSGTLMWADGDAAAKTFTVMLCGDLLRPDTQAPTEATETVNLTLSNPMGTTITGTNPATLNITDNPPGTIQFSSATFNGTEGAMATITATRTLGSFGAVSVMYATSDGTATTAGSDYTSTSGTLSWADGDTASKTFTVPLTCDTTPEGTETVNLTLSAPTGGAVIGATNPATLNIADAVGACAFCNADGPIAIPSSGVSTPYPSVINVSGTTGNIVSMRVTLNNIQHTDQTDIDILLVGPGGQKFILMSDAGDNTGLDTAATLTFDGAAASLIPTGAVATGSYRPTNVGTGDTFAAPAPAAPYLTPASAGADTLASAFGGSSPNGTWSLYVVDDTGGDLGTISGWCLDFVTSVAPIPGQVQFSSATYSVVETGVMATITATRTSGSDGTITVDYATVAGGTATAGSDYTTTTGTLTFLNGETSKTFDVPITDDMVFEGNETVNLALTNPTGGAALGAPVAAVLTITDNETPPGDTCATAVPLTLNMPTIGTLQNMNNDFTLAAPGAPTCFTGSGQGATTAIGRDRVYSFTPLATGTYTIRAKFANTGANMALYLTTTCPGSSTVFNCQNTGGTDPVATFAANRNSSTSAGHEDISCINLTAATTYYVVVDETTLGAGTGSFELEATLCNAEFGEANGTPATASAITNNSVDGILTLGDVDFYTIGTPTAGSRLFAIVDTNGSSAQDTELRVTTATDTLEYDDDDGDTQFGAAGSNIQGLPLTAVPTYFRLNEFGSDSVVEPYKLTYIIKDQGTETPEAEPNDTIGTANGPGNGYFSGALSGASDVDIYSVSVEPGTLLYVGLDTNPLRDNTAFDGTLALLDASGNVVVSVNGSASSASNTSGAGSLTATTPNSAGEALTFRVPTSLTPSAPQGNAPLVPQQYYVRVTGAAAGDYLLAIGGNNVPTASGVTVSGRVMTSDGRPIRFARMNLVNVLTGDALETQTDERGVFEFDDNVLPGATYSLTVTHYRYTFANNTRVFNVAGDLEGILYFADKRTTRVAAPDGP